MELIEHLARLFESRSEAFELKNLQDLGLWGDFIGGVLGTIISIFGLVYIVRTFRTTRYSSYFVVSQQTVYQMIEAYDRAVDTIEARGGEIKGRDAFLAYLGEFNWIYDSLLSMEVGEVDFSNQKLTDRISITFAILFYGDNIDIFRGLPSTPRKELIRMVTRLELQRRWEAEQNEVRDYLSGHHRSLGHYYRIIYAIYLYIDGLTELSFSEKYMLCKQLRIRLTNYEQALLALNIISHFGRSWRKNNLVDRYQPIKNIPEDFFEFDRSFDLKRIFPGVSFEFEDDREIDPNQELELWRAQVMGARWFGF